MPVEDPRTIGHFARTRRCLDAIRGDLLFAVRLLRNSPGFTLTAVLTLALGIGLNTAIFGMVRAALLAPLPYPAAGRMVYLLEQTKPGVQLGVPWRDYRQWQRLGSDFVHMGAYQPRTYFLSRHGGPPRQVSAIWVTDSILQLLRAKPAAGRLFGQRDQEPGSHPVALLGAGIFRHLSHSDRSVVGRTITLHGLFWANTSVTHAYDTKRAFTVAGVLPPSFLFPLHRPDLLLPLGRRSSDEDMASPTARPLVVLGELRRGISVGQARSQIGAIMRRIAHEHPGEDEGVRPLLIPLRDELVGKSARSGLILLLSAAGLVLLLACANVAQLALTRGIARRREFAVRTALGARHGHLVRQLLVEHGLVAAAGGVFGVGLAELTVRSLALAYPGQVFRLRTAQVNGSVFLFALGASVLALLLFGLAPALEARRTELRGLLDERAGPGPSYGKLRSALLVGQVALALVLATSAGLVLRSLSNAMRVNLGFDPNHLFELTMGSFALPQHRSQASAFTFYRESAEQVRRLPGIVAVGLASSGPLAGMEFAVPYSVGASPPGNDANRTLTGHILPGFFRTLKTRLIVGRFFSRSDVSGKARVAIVNDTLAREIAPNGSAIGKELYCEYLYPHKVVRVVGVVANIRQQSPVVGSLPEIYTPAAPATLSLAATMVVRSSVAPASVERSVTQAIQALDGQELVTGVKSFNSILSSDLAEQRSLATLLTLFGVFAVALVILGASGAMAYMAASRRHEIGLRMALGAQPRQASWLVLREGMALAGLGVALGVGGSLASARLLGTQLFLIQPSDPATLTGATLLVAAAALVASWIPARRASRIDPAASIREE